MVHLFLLVCLLLIVLQEVLFPSLALTHVLIALLSRCIGGLDDLVGPMHSEQAFVNAHKTYAVVARC